MMTSRSLLYKMFLPAALLIGLWNVYRLHDIVVYNSDFTFKSTAQIGDASMPHLLTLDTTLDTTITTAKELNPPPPQNLHISFVGDSLSRYMYLSLVYYLKHNEWAPLGHELLEKVKDPDNANWNEWLRYTNSNLQPYEECDCYRYWKKKYKWSEHCENRYYSDFLRDNHVTFITKFGRSPFHGHWNVSQVYHRKQRASKRQKQEKFNNEKEHIEMTLSPYLWEYSSWSDLVNDYLSKLTPKPDFFIFNQGHWSSHELNTEKVLKKLRRSLKAAGIRGIYRTTTFRRDEPNKRFKNLRNHDKRVCQYFDCLDVGWTASISADSYIDDVHFTAEVYNRMNRQFLELLNKTMN